VTFAASSSAIETKNGIRVLPEQTAADWPAERRIPAISKPPAKALDGALQEIAARYGSRTTDFIAMQLEYPRRP
jgi:hypothetical protein